MPSSYNEPAILEEQIDRASGAGDNISGQYAGGRATATEASLVAQLGGARFQLASMWFDEKLKRKKLEKDYKLLQSRMDQEQIVELAGSPPRRLPVDMRSLLWDVDIYVDSGIFGSLDSIQLQSYTQIYQLAASNPQADQYLRHGDIIRDLFVRAGDPYVDRHIRSEDEVQRMAAQDAQQQQGLEDAGAGRQAGLDTNRELARGFASAISSGGGGGGS